MADIESLWGEEFELPKEKEKTKKIIDKISKPKEIKVTVEKQVKSKKLSLKERLELITTEVYRVLGKQKDNVVTIKDRQSLHDYITKCIQNNRIDIDTETNNSLDPITCKLMGPCFYTPGEKQAYVPINHRDPDTKERLPWQLTEKDIQEELQRIIDNNVFTIYHNGKFDYQVIKCTCNGIKLPISWDTLIGAKLLDENERSYSLKDQYCEKIDREQEKYNIEHLFKNVEYADVDPEVFALYAATDSMMTDKLYDYQIVRFRKPGNEKLLKLAETLEMPLVTVIAEMELAGMEVDQDYGKLLSVKYHKQLDDIDAKINAELALLKPKIDAWRLTPEATNKQTTREEKVGKSKSEQLTEPINLASPTQLAILFYDVLKAPVVDKKQPRATGEEALKALSEKMQLSIFELLVKRREISKLLTTYIDVIPELAKRWPDGRVRTHFNAYGAATGRLSSSEPLNFQNIPSHNKEIRMLFCSRPGYKIIGSDYSAQEPRLTAHMSQDPAMIQAYREGKDLYSVIASMSFDRKYEDCLEFYPEGTHIMFEGHEVVCGHKTHQNKEGKMYRSMAKSLLLGIEYGRGAASVGEQINKSREEAQKIIDDFFSRFKKVKKFVDDSINDAHVKGYVEDVAGRRRRLPDAQLPKYTIKDLNVDKNTNFNPFLECKDRAIESKLIDKYAQKLEKIRYAKDYEKIQADALKEGIEIHSNTGFIAQAERQAVNSRIQGGAASLTKQALLDIYYDPELRKMNAYLINTVHDEILIEAPDNYAEQAADRLVNIMINSAKKYIDDVPMSCDPYITNCWYLDEFNVLVNSEFKKLLDSGVPSDQAFEKLAESRSESTRSQLYELVKGYLGDYVPKDVDITYKSLS